jgi:CheY-like chemotaxis protein
MGSDYPPSILVVDDNRLVQELIRDTFVAEGFAVRTAAHGREGLERAAEERPDLIITDVEMPEMDGWAFCEALKSDPQTRDVPLIFLAAEREVHHRLRGLRLGAYDYLCKPFSPEELLVRVKLILERSRKGSPANETPRSFLAGHTSHMPIPDLVQLLAMNGKTGCLRLRGPEMGRIHFREGRVVGAFTARARGRKALLRVMSWSDADFHFDPVDDPALSEDLGDDTQRLLMDALVALDDLEHLRVRLPRLDAHFRLGEGARALLTRAEELEETDLQVLRLAREGITLREILDRTEGTDLEVTRALLRLLDQHGLEPAGEEG